MLPCHKRFDTAKLLTKQLPCKHKSINTSDTQSHPLTLHRKPFERPLKRPLGDVPLRGYLHKGNVVLHAKATHPDELEVGVDVLVVIHEYAVA